MGAKESKVESIFYAALEKSSAAGRAGYLDEACAGDSELRGRVEFLLSAQPNLGSFLENDAPGVAPTIDQPPTEQPGTMIGPYKLVEEIGEGGMGSVFMAVQKKPVCRKVALKVIKPGMDSKQVVSRFEAERQALAMMDHPSIARVLDGGSTESGRPYFVMELVRGVPITDYCDKHKFTTNERLELFGDVCQAVQHAHQKGIIHRDLKPSNIMVTLYDGKPVPKVIDFGVAKATSGQLSEATLVTNYAQMIGTPLYMSPEQATLTSQDIDTRSDVYSLGVLLYELLTGTTPLERERVSELPFDELRRIIREEEPPRPSARLSTLSAALDTALETASENRHANRRTLSGQLSGELDWIVMKALEKDRTRRYDSAADLARDVQRYLDDDPVEACPPSKVYRFRKFARRNRTLFAASTVVGLALVLGAGISTWQAYRATKAESEARYQQVRAEQNLKLALEAVDQIYLEFVDERSPTFGVDGSTSQEPITPEGEKFLRKAMRFYEQFVETNRQSVWARHETAKAYNKVAGIHERLQMHSEAVAVSSQSIQAAEQLVAEFPRMAEYRKTLADAYCNRAGNSKDIGKHGEAFADYNKAVRLDPQYAMPYSVRGTAYFHDREYQKAIADYSETIRINPRDAIAYNNRGVAHGKNGEDDKAIDDHNESIRLNPNSARHYFNRASVYVHKREDDKAIADCSETIRLDPQHVRAYLVRGQSYTNKREFEKALPDYNKGIRLAPKEAMCYLYRAGFYLQRKQCDLALADLKKALELQPRGWLPIYNMALFLLNCPDHDLRDTARALKLAEAEVKRDPKKGIFWSVLGQARYRSGDYQAAVEALNTSIRLGFKHQTRNWFFLAMAHWKLDHKEQAREYYQQAVAWMAENHPSDTAYPQSQFRDEASEVLGIEKLAKSEEKKEPLAKSSSGEE